MKPNESAQDIIEWFKTYELEQGVEPLLTARQTLSIAMSKIANYYKDTEIKNKKKYAERRIKEAISKLEYEGTGVFREAKAIEVNKDLRIESATLEGECLGIKQILNSYGKVLDSMSSMINTLNR